MIKWLKNQREQFLYSFTGIKVLRGMWGLLYRPYTCKYMQESVAVELEDMLFLYNEDFDYIRPALDSIFPLTDPRTGEEMKALDPCWDNPIMKEVWTGVLAELDQQLAEEPELELQAFLGHFIRWIKKHLEFADGIEVIGNL